MKKKQLSLADVLIVLAVGCLILIIIVPLVNAVAISFSTQREYLNHPLLLFPTAPTLENYRNLLADQRIATGFKTSLLIVCLGVPLNLFLTLSLAYGTSRPSFPGKKFILAAILFTMLFNGGILPLYMQMRELKLTNTIWSVVLASGVNVFYFVIARNFFCSIPQALVESAQLDGAGEWRILFSVILPLAKPIVATVALFCIVDRWNEWYNALIFIRSNDIVPLQVVLRSIVMESNISSSTSSMEAAARNFDMGIKMAAVIVTTLPIMCIFPFLQKHFTKGVMVGAIKS